MKWKWGDGKGKGGGMGKRDVYWTDHGKVDGNTEDAVNFLQLNGWNGICNREGEGGLDTVGSEVDGGAG